MWHDHGRDVVWRVDEMSQAVAPALSPTGTIDRVLDLADTWWSDLHTALGNLASHDTNRVWVQQSHPSQRISEVYGDQVDTTVAEWACAHGDAGTPTSSPPAHDPGLGRLGEGARRPGRGLPVVRLPGGAEPGGPCSH